MLHRIFDEITNPAAQSMAPRITVAEIAIAGVMRGGRGVCPQIGDRLVLPGLRLDDALDEFCQSIGSRVLAILRGSRPAQSSPHNCTHQWLQRSTEERFECGRFALRAGGAKKLLEQGVRGHGIIQYRDRTTGN